MVRMVRLAKFNHWLFNWLVV